MSSRAQTAVDALGSSADSRRSSTGRPTQRNVVKRCFNRSIRGETKPRAARNERVIAATMIWLNDSKYAP